jgi:hypothetical protein
MAMKIIIVDNIKRLIKGEKEAELPNDTRIRFETDDYKIEVYFNGKSIRIYKLGKQFEDDIINISPHSCNMVDIK